MASGFLSQGEGYMHMYICIKACTYVSAHQTSIIFILALLFQKQCDQTQRWLFYKEILKSLLPLRFLPVLYCSQSAIVIILKWGFGDSSLGLVYPVSFWCTGTYILLLLLLTTIAIISNFKCCIRFYSLVFPSQKKKANKEKTEREIKRWQEYYPLI